MSLKAKRPRFQVGDEVWINPQESECQPFRALICGVKCDWNGLGFDDPEYSVVEIFEKFKREEYSCPSDGWTENMLFCYYPR